MRWRIDLLAGLPSQPSRRESHQRADRQQEKKLDYRMQPTSSRPPIGHPPQTVTRSMCMTLRQFRPYAMLFFPTHEKITITTKQCIVVPMRPDLDLSSWSPRSVLKTLTSYCADRPCFPYTLFPGVGLDCFSCLSINSPRPLGASPMAAL